MERPTEVPIRLGGGTLSWPADYDAERARIDAEISRRREQIARLELERARVDAREAAEAAKPGVIR